MTHKTTSIMTSKLGNELLEAAHAMLAHRRGEADYPTSAYEVPSEVDVTHFAPS